MNPFRRITLLATAAAILAAWAAPAAARAYSGEYRYPPTVMTNDGHYRGIETAPDGYWNPRTPRRALSHARRHHRAAPETARGLTGHPTASRTPLPERRPVVDANANPARMGIIIDEAKPQADAAESPGYLAAVVSAARAYLVRTSSPGYTMTRLGPEVAVGFLNPVFALRLADAIRDARASGLPHVGIYSCYRPPAFGVGGFSDKFDSAHSYGIAADLKFIGSPGSRESALWHRIALAHGLFNPYYGRKAVEFNHYQATNVTMVRRAAPGLRRTITAAGPKDKTAMWKAAERIIPALAAAELYAVEYAAAVP